MARGKICIDYGDKIVHVHCENNASLNEAGLTLLKFYKTTEEIEQILTIGAFSHVYENIVSIKQRRYDGYSPQTYTKKDDYVLEEFLQNLSNCSPTLRFKEDRNNILYMWKENNWYYLNSASNYMFKKLSEIIGG